MWRSQTPGRDGVLLGVMALHLYIFVTLSEDLVMTELEESDFPPVGMRMFSFLSS